MVVTPYGIGARTFPSMAVDPNDPSLVYLIFAARDDQAANANNVDVFIAFSDDFGVTFESANTYRLTDQQLAFPTADPNVEADHVFPAITIDGLGGINILFYHSTSPDWPGGTPPATPTLARVVYARFADRTQLAGTPFVSDLTGPFRVRRTASDDPGMSIGFRGNEYMGLAANGCVVYAAYCRTDGAEGRDGWVCARRIVIGADCGADADGNGLVNSNDPPSFMAAYAAGTPRADVNLDGSVDAQDGVAFLSAYSAAGGGAP